MKVANYPLVLSAFMCFFAGVYSGRECKRLSTAKLICYYSTLEEIDGCHCTHVVLPANSDVKGIERVKERAKGVKVYVSVNEFNQGLINLLKTSKVDGLELNLKKLDSKNDIADFISTVKTKIGPDLDIALAVPSKADLVAKYFDFKALSKHADLFILQTAFLGASTNVTFHPSRLSGMWDMQNTDSVVDLVSGLGAPLSKLVVAAPVQGFHFTLQNQDYTAPGSPALELRSITRNELCKLMHANKNWTLERDEDQAGPYIFSKDQWIAFEDSKSIDIKTKYSRVRGLAGIALKDLAQDGGSECGSSILEAAYNGLSRQARAPRGAVLHSLEREIVDSSAKPLDSVQLSPYRISRIIDTEGKIHVVRQDSRTEFQCTRQGYFVHPRSCNRFYRCVKFNQLSEDYNVFEFDCPAGLAFDERVEVCVWPGSLPHGTPCSGSSEIAPVPRGRFVCPSEPGYYADPENCRWFFACLDHGKSPLSAYEFRCPFGLVFDGDRLVCEWPWLVPKCAGGLGVGLDSEHYYGAVAGGNGLGEGYAAKGLQSSRLILQNYDGIGTLGTVKLGGLSGKIEKPIATLYSNVGASSLGLGYQNTGGYIEGGGLSYKAAQALQTAGLLKVNNGVGYQATGHDEQDVLYATAGQSVDGAAYSHYAGQSGANQGTLLVHTDGNYGSGANAYAAGHLEASAGLHGSSNVYQGANIHLVQDNSVTNGYGGAAGTNGAYSEVAGANVGYTGVVGAHGEYSGIAGANGGYSGVSTANGGYSGVSSANGEYSGVLTANGEYSGVAGANEGYSGVIGANGQYSGSAGANGAVSSQSFIQYHGAGEHTGGYQGVNNVNSAAYIGTGDAHASTGTGTFGYKIQNNAGGYETSNQVTGYSGGVDLNQQNGGYVNVGSIDAHGGSGYANTGAFVTGQTDFTNKESDFGVKFQDATRGGAGGAVSTQSFTQFHGQKGSKNIDQFGTGVAGNINIVGGGYSAVGTLSGIDISNNGEANIVSGSPALVSVTTAPVSKIASVPTVTAVPVPGIKTVAGFETIRGGVIANIPELQYKVKSLEDAGLFSNFSTNFANFVVTSPATDQKEVIQQTYSQNGGYAYEKPSKAFEEGLFNTITVSTARPFVSVTTGEPQVYVSSTVKPLTIVEQKAQAGYVYEKPAVSFQETPVVYSTPAPVTVVQPAVSTVTFQKYGANGGYKYEKPSVEFEERPQSVVVNSYSTVSTPKPAVVVEQHPQIIVSSTPAAPAVSSYSYTQQSNHGGYVYDRPSVAFEEKPEAPSIISKFTIRKPVVQQQTVQSNGYYYEKKPIAVQQPTILNEIPTVQLKQKTVVEDYTYQQPAVVSQYFHQQPSVKQGPVVPLYQQPELLSTYTYQPPIQKQPVSTYTYQNVAQQAVGVAYQQPDISLAQRPAQTYSYQPSAGTSYQYINFENGHQQKAQGGYVYSKPSVAFEEKPQVTYQYSTPQPTVVVQETKSQGGYVYEKPAVTFEETPVTYSTPKPTVAVQPAVITSYFNLASSKANAESAKVHQQESIGYAYPKPAVHFDDIPVTYSTPKPVVKPAVVTSYFNIASSKANAESSAQQAEIGYAYDKPTVHFEETPVTYSTPKPFVAQPAVVSSYFNIASSKANSESAHEHQNVGYTYQKPSVQFLETPLTYSTPKPVVVQPIAPVESAIPAEVTNYFNTGGARTDSDSAVEHQHVGYTYPKPEVAFEETYSTPKPVQPIKSAVVTSYFNIKTSNPEEIVTYSTPKPFAVQPAVAVQPHQPAVVTSYVNFGSSTPQPQEYVQEEKVGYSYPQPEIKFEETPLVYSTPKPAVVSSYSYVAPTTPKPAVVEENVGYAYPKPDIKFEKKPAVVYSYSYTGSTTPQPNVIVEEQQPQVVVEATPKPAVITSYFHQQPSKGYDYPKPSVHFEEEPQQPIEEVPFVKKTAYITGQYQQNSQENYNYEQNYQHTGKVVVENYQFPEYEKVKQAVFGEKAYQQQDQVQYQPEVVLNYVQSTPKPTFISTIRPVVRKKLHPVTPATVTVYDSRYSSTPESYIASTIAPEVHVVSTTSRPISRYSFSSLDDQYQYNDIVKSTTEEPVRTYLPVTSTVRVTSALPKITRTKVVEEFVAPEVATLAREYLPVRVRTKAPAREYLPVDVTAPSKEYLPVRVRTKAPAKDYLPVEVTTPFREYLPATRVKVTTVAPEYPTPSNEYLPVRSRVRVTTTGAPLEDLTYTIKPRRPATIKVARPVTIIKQNDAHPLLSAKLGAQCTCVSNTLRLRKKQKIIIVDDDENDDDDDGYIVDNGDQGNAVESYSYEPQRVVDITPTPEVYLKSSTVEPQAYIKKRVKVRPVSKQPYYPVTEVSEIFYQKNTSPALIEDDSAPSDKEVAKAVRTGLKLVKQAAKDGAREGTEEVLSKQFDRYGPGGVRSRSESLQGTIDCQRAGLFRHPSECNKFYACRWDCTKNRFTLHVFNCPVHLTFDNTLGACNWPSQGPACVENTLITSD